MPVNLQEHKRPRLDALVGAEVPADTGSAGPIAKSVEDRREACRKESRGKFDQAGNDIQPVENEAGVKGTPGESDGAAPEMQMAPWEQHAGVISMPRYDYTAGVALLEGGKGFFLTCPFRREKSATNEVLALLAELLPTPQDGREAMGAQAGVSPKQVVAATDSTAGTARASEAPGEAKTNVPGEDSSSSEKNVTGSLEPQKPQAPGRPSTGETAKPPEDSKGKQWTEKDKQGEGDGGGAESRAKTARAEKEDETPRAESLGGLTLVKLGSMGIGFIAMAATASVSPLAVVETLLRDIAASRRTPLKWCNRVLPVLATCPVDPTKIRTSVVELMRSFLDGPHVPPGGTVKFAVSFKRRGIEETTKGGIEPGTSLSRGDLISVVAEAVGAAADSASPPKKVLADLSNPQVAVFLEILPLARSENVCAISVLPQHLVEVKPRLLVKSVAKLEKASKQSTKK